MSKRFVLDSEYLEKGNEYYEMPEVYIIYISETDLWKAGRCVYPVNKYFDGTEIPYDDGMHILYVNAAVDDGTDIAKLMDYFKTADPEKIAKAVEVSVATVKQWLDGAVATSSGA